MQKFQQLKAIACPLPLANIDTDQLIPARFMKRTRANGYGDYLLRDLRFDANDEPNPGFLLNAPDRSGAGILVSRRNFGCGSSREAAVYALVDYGIRCVIAPSFGDIFAANAVNNGLLPASVAEGDAEVILDALMGGELELIVDLKTRIVDGSKFRIPFEIDPVWRTKLLNGWDDIDLTMSHQTAIDTFVQADTGKRPWARGNPLSGDERVGCEPFIGSR